MLEPALLEARLHETPKSANENSVKSVSAAAAGASDNVEPKSPLVAAPDIDLDLDIQERMSEMEAPPLSRALDAEMAEMQEHLSEKEI